MVSSTLFLISYGERIFSVPPKYGLGTLYYGPMSNGKATILKLCSVYKRDELILPASSSTKRHVFKAKMGDVLLSSTFKRQINHVKG